MKNERRKGKKRKDSRKGLKETRRGGKAVMRGRGDVLKREGRGGEREEAKPENKDGKIDWLQERKKGGREGGGGEGRGSDGVKGAWTGWRERGEKDENKSKQRVKKGRCVAGKELGKHGKG